MLDKKLKHQNGKLDGNHVEYLIELRGVAKNFENAASPFAALRGIDLKVKPGEFVAVIGKFGSGKSALLNIIADIDRLSSGEVFVAGERVNTMTEDALARWRGENLGIVFQFFQMLPSITLSTMQHRSTLSPTNCRAFIAKRICR
jgi:putative ABC transport system ATP-binding protein